jgi:hypothetical protein
VEGYTTGRAGIERSKRRSWTSRILPASTRGRLTIVAAVVVVILASAVAVFTNAFGVLSPTAGDAFVAGGSSAAAGGASAAVASASPGSSGSASPSAPPPSSAAPRASSAPARPGAPVPAAPAGFAGPSNTGYKNAPGYPGHLTDYSPAANGTECSGPIVSGKTYHFCRFVGSGGSAALTVGSVNNPVQNTTFFGCLFLGNEVDNAAITYANGNNITWDYATIAPSAVAAAPVAYGKGYQYGINQVEDDRSSNYLHGHSFTLNHADVWGFGNGIQLGSVTQAAPVAVRNSWFHDASADGGNIYHTDGILSNDGDGIQYLTVDHNTFVSKGNTNGLALQYAGTYYANITVTNNYFSGFGYTVNIGGAATGNRNVTFTGNTFGTDIAPVYGPLYGWADGNGNTWRGNKWHVAPGGYSSKTSDDGKYWWPDGTLSTTDYTG